MLNVQQLNNSAVYAKQRQHSETFVRGADGYLHYYYFENGIWNHDGESFKAAKVDGAVSAVFAPQRNHSEVFFRGEDGYLHYYYVVPGVGWHHDGESFKAAKVDGAVSAVFVPQRNHSEVFFRGDDGCLHYYYVASPAVGWHHDGESFKAAKVDGAISAVFATQRNHSEVFFRGEDGCLHYYYVASPAVGWHHDGESFKAAKVDGAVSAVFATQRNHSEVFFRGEDGYLHYYYVASPAVGWHHDGESFKAAKVDGAVSAVFATQRNHSEVFFRGEDGYLHYYYVVPGGGWLHDGGSFNAAKVDGAVSAVFATQRNHSEVFFRGEDSYLHYYYVPVEVRVWTHEMPELVSIFTGGYYNIDIPGLGWAQHTYVLVNHGSSNEVKFPCYGGYDPDRRLDGSIYPATLYNPAILPPYTTYGTQADGNVRLARGIACGDLNAPLRENYDRKTGGPYLLGDCCGLIYAVNGVCHHMEARIFWACRNTPIIWPPSGTASYWVWLDWNMGTGFYGNSWNIWKPIFERMKTSISQQAILSVQDEMLTLLRKSAQAALAQAEQPELRDALAQTISSEAVSSISTASAVLEEMVKFHQFKAERDRQILNGTVSREEYATQLNQEFLSTMRKMKDMLSPEDYQKMFGRSAAEPEIPLGIDASKIPDNLGDLKLID